MSEGPGPRLYLAQLSDISYTVPDAKDHRAMAHRSQAAAPMIATERGRKVSEIHLVDWWSVSPRRYAQQWQKCRSMWTELVGAIGVSSITALPMGEEARAGCVIIDQPIPCYDSTLESVGDLVRVDMLTHWWVSNYKALHAEYEGPGLIDSVWIHKEYMNCGGGLPWEGYPSWRRSDAVIHNYGDEFSHRLLLFEAEAGPYFILFPRLDYDNGVRCVFIRGGMLDNSDIREKVAGATPGIMLITGREAENAARADGEGSVYRVSRKGGDFMFPDASIRRGLRLDIQKAAPLRKTWTLGELARVCQARQSLLFHAIAGSGDTTLCTDRTGCYVQVAQRESASYGTLQLRPAAVSELVEEGCYHHRDGAIVLPWDGRVLYHLRGHVVESAAEGATPLSMDDTVNGVAGERL